MVRIMEILAFAVFLGFVGILVWKVPEVDLIVVVAITVALVGYDFATNPINNTIASVAGALRSIRWRVLRILKSTRS